MSEREYRSLKSDALVGVGGLVLALAASFSELKEIVESIPESPFFTNPGSPQACLVDSEAQNVYCTPSVDEKCHEELISDVRNPQYEGWILVPQSCKESGVVVGSFNE